MARPLAVVLDTETTGLGRRDRAGPREDGIVQVGLAWRAPDDGEVKTWRRFCDPGARYYEGGRATVAFRINGRTEAEVRAAPPARLVAAELRATLEELRLRYGALDLRAYNAGFDRAFLEAEPWRVEGAWGPCVMLAAARALDPHGKWPTLPEACRGLGLRHPGPAHDAGADAHAALLVAEALERRQAPVAARS